MAFYKLLANVMLFIILGFTIWQYTSLKPMLRYLFALSNVTSFFVAQSSYFEAGKKAIQCAVYSMIASRYSLKL